MPIRTANDGYRSNSNAGVEENRLITGVRERFDGNYHEADHRTRGRRWVGKHGRWKRVGEEEAVRTRGRQVLAGRTMVGEKVLNFDIGKNKVGCGVTRDCKGKGVVSIAREKSVVEGMGFTRCGNEGRLTAQLLLTNGPSSFWVLNNSGLYGGRLVAHISLLSSSSELPGSYQSVVDGDSVQVGSPDCHKERMMSDGANGTAEQHTDEEGLGIGLFGSAQARVAEARLENQFGYADSGSESDVENRLISGTDFSEPLLCSPINIMEPGCDFLNKDLVYECLLIEYGFGSDEEISEWVKTKVKGLSRFLGTSYGGHEEQVVSLFSSIEKNWRLKQSLSPKRKLISPEERRKRELKKLEWLINYVGREGAKGGVGVNGANQIRDLVSL